LDERTVAAVSAGWACGAMIQSDPAQGPSNLLPRERTVPLAHGHRQDRTTSRCR